MSALSRTTQNTKKTQDKMKTHKVALIAAHLFPSAAMALSMTIFATPRACAQEVALKTNMLYWATTTPNAGMEVGLGEKTTGQVFFGLNPWKQSGGDHSSLRHWVVQPELRHWFCQKFNGWFVGVHAMGGQYNAGGVKLPLGFFPALEDHRYKGWYVGGGLTAGNRGTPYCWRRASRCDHG